MAYLRRLIVAAAVAAVAVALPLAPPSRGSELEAKIGGMAKKVADFLENQKQTKQDRNIEMKKQLDNPPLHLDDCKVKTSKDSPYAVEVLVRPEGERDFKPAHPTNNKGHAFVELKKGDVYKLRLHNDTKYEAAV